MSCVGGEEGIRSRLRARSGCVLTPLRGVIHSAPVRILSNANAKRTPFGVLRWRRGRDSNPCALSRKLISSLCVNCLLAFLQSRTVRKKSRLHKGFSDEMTLKGIVRDGSNIISIFPYPSKIRQIGGMFGGMLNYFFMSGNTAFESIGNIFYKESP